MKKILIGAFLAMSFIFAGASMAATLTLNNIGDTATYGDAGLTDTASDPTKDFDINHIIALNVPAKLMINSYELLNIKDFLVYKLYDSASNLITVFDFYNINKVV